MKVARYDRRLRDPHPVFLRALYKAALQRMFDRFEEALSSRLPMFRTTLVRPPLRFQPRDIVTRGGDDRQLVLSVSDDTMVVRCTKAPASGWCKIGDEESNLCRRYTFPDDVLDGSARRVNEPLLLEAR